MISARTIVVAAGTIESSKLLLRSTSEHYDSRIGNDRDLVGRNFITHPYFIFTAQIANNPRGLQTEMDFPTLCSRHFDSPEEQAAGKFILVNPPQVPSSLSLVKLMQNGVRGDPLLSAIRGPAQIQLHGMLEVFSRFENRIKSLDKVNHLGLQRDDRQLHAGRGLRRSDGADQEHVTAIFGEIGAKLVGKPSISWRADHAACTLRMKPRRARAWWTPICGCTGWITCTSARTRHLRARAQ